MQNVSLQVQVIAGLSVKNFGCVLIVFFSNVIWINAYHFVLYFLKKVCID